MDVLVNQNQLQVDKYNFRCSTGRGGLLASKKEGDGATPVGTFHFRQAFYRPDRMEKPECNIPIRAMEKSDGWCDDPSDPLYNRLVSLPYPGRHEVLWRDDDVYALVVVIGYNDDPITPGAGSAIFMHIAREDYRPTDGCVALSLNDLLVVLRSLNEDSKIIIQEGTLTT